MRLCVFQPSSWGSSKPWDFLLFWRTAQLSTRLFLTITVRTVKFAIWDHFTDEGTVVADGCIDLDRNDGSTIIKDSTSGGLNVMSKSRTRRWFKDVGGLVGCIGGCGATSNALADPFVGRCRQGLLQEDSAGGFDRSQDQNHDDRDTNRKLDQGGRPLR